VGAVADRLLVVARLDPEGQRAPVNAHQFRGGADPHADRRGGEVADIEMNAEALMFGRQQRLDRRERRRLDDVDHDRRTQHRDQPAADAGRRMLDADQQFGRPGETRFQLGQFDCHESPSVVASPA
jgi:hypothetical protein